LPQRRNPDVDIPFPALPRLRDLLRCTLAQTQQNFSAPQNWPLAAEPDGATPSVLAVDAPWAIRFIRNAGLLI
jgi:hypothetical protein